ncbi:MAG: carbohydrate-binding protein [Gorillibacterium sp.]|nr:carbohydrate-binding protein [Gorillibacterium sp.]
MILLFRFPMTPPSVQAEEQSANAEESIYAFEAEASINQLSGNAEIKVCDPTIGCSNDQLVGNLWGGSALQFNEVSVNASGIYVMTIHYISGDPRSYGISVNGSATDHYDFPKTTDWNTRGIYELELALQQGQNTIKFEDEGGYSPDIDKIDLHLAASEPVTDPGNVDGISNIGLKVNSAKYGSIAVVEHENGLTLSNGQYKITYNTDSGLAAYDWNGKTRVKGIYSSIQLDKLLDSRNYALHQFKMSRVERIKDGHGKGIRVTIENLQSGLPTMKQIYQIYDGQLYFLTSLQVLSDTTISTNDMAPIVLNSTGAIDIGSNSDNRVMVAPFDNDMWSRYQARTINTSLNNNNYLSSELTAIYDNTSRNGLVIGSVTHDLWKTGIYWSGSDDRLNKLKVYGGFSSVTSTHDTIQHGKVTGTTLTSPQIYVGFYADYREGLEGFGQANAAVAPPLIFERGVPKGVPVGWNSWGAYDSGLNYGNVVDVSNFFKENLQKSSFANNGNVYINLDSYWDNLSEQQLRDAVSVIRKNGQKAGIYYSPFVYWGDNMSQPVEGTDGKYTYGDIIMRDLGGNPLPKMDGAYAIDPTHPGSKQRIKYYFNRFLDYGFEYIKIDFLSHGSLEGKHYDPNVQTGIQAYNQGMAYINEALDGKMFISASIAPLFPSQYAHARRISCDVDGSLSRTEYQLNNLTYGWWQSGTIYSYTDPDYMSLVKGGSLAAAQTRVNSAVISGTVYLNSDDVNDPIAQEYMKALLTNKQVNAVAIKGKAFRPIEGNTGIGAADSFVLKDGKDYYLAVFNYTNESVMKTIDFKRADIPYLSKTTVTDLWTNKTKPVTGPFKVSLDGAQSKFYKISVK